MADDPKNTIKVELVHNWRRAWTWFSMQAMAAAGLLLTVWATIPEDLKAVLPPVWTKGIAIGLIVLGIAGRLVKQKDKP
jgi:hypothetical protein